MWIESKDAGYFFSSFGRAARMLKKGTHRVLIGCASGAGYRAISIPKGDGSYRRVYIHRGVCETFNGPCPEGMECRHLNGDMFDNRPENLCWGTPDDNTQDKKLHGTVAKGEKNGGAKLTREKVNELRQVRAELGLTYKALAAMFGVTTMTAFRAAKGDTWN